MTDTKTIHLLPQSYSSITYPDHQFCKKCAQFVLKINTNSTFYINASVLNMTHNGANNTVSCNYAGLAAYDKETETAVVCQKPHYSSDVLDLPHVGSNMPYVLQSIFSTDSFMTLVLYSYPEYVNTNMVLSLRTTTCKPRTVNLCEGGRSDIYFETKIDQCTILQLIYGAGNITDEYDYTPGLKNLLQA